VVPVAEPLYGGKRHRASAPPWPGRDRRHRRRPHAGPAPLT